MNKKSYTLTHEGSKLVQKSKAIVSDFFFLQVIHDFFSTSYTWVVLGAMSDMKQYNSYLNERVFNKIKILK